eukprot:m.9709 g.9709  ORF g.9709 m.9709 type:complete len:312 (+) comp5624_c0_seq1:1570-2505(+)
MPGDHDVLALASQGFFCAFVQVQLHTVVLLLQPGLHLFEVLGGRVVGQKLLCFAKVKLLRLLQELGLKGFFVHTERVDDAGFFVLESKLHKTVLHTGHQPSIDALALSLLFNQPQCCSHHLVFHALEHGLLPHHQGQLVHVVHKVAAFIPLLLDPEAVEVVALVVKHSARYHVHLPLVAEVGQQVLSLERPRARHDFFTALVEEIIHTRVQLLAPKSGSFAFCACARYWALHCCRTRSTQLVDNKKNVHVRFIAEIHVCFLLLEILVHAAEALQQSLPLLLGVHFRWHIVSSAFPPPSLLQSCAQRKKNFF